MKGISVIICCHNSSNKLPTTLDFILKQNVFNIKWELIIVDNASFDSTIQTAEAYTTKFQEIGITLKIIKESKVGLSNARKAGLLESNYQYIIFCDDDNWLSNDYITKVYNLFENSNIDVIGGTNSPVFETPPKKWINDYLEGYACNTAKPSGYVDLIFGAGMGLRKAKLMTIYNTNYVSLLTGRKGNNITSGEDSEICYLILLSGGKIWYESTLTLKHFITSDRLSWNYCKKLFASFDQSGVILKLYIEALKQNNATKLPWSYWIKNFFYYFLLLLKYSFKYLINNNVEGNAISIQFLSWKLQMIEYWHFKWRLNSFYKRIHTLNANKNF